MLDTRPEIEPIYQSLGAVVLELRSDAGWTQQDLACQIGLTRASVANVETGRQRLMIHQVQALAEVFNVPIGRLLGFAVDVASDSEKVAALRKKLADVSAEKNELKMKLTEIGRIAHIPT